MKPEEFASEDKYRKCLVEKHAKVFLALKKLEKIESLVNLALSSNFEGKATLEYIQNILQNKSRHTESEPSDQISIKS